MLAAIRFFSVVPVATLLAFSLPSCKSTEKINAQAPAVQAIVTKPFERKLSAINIPLSFNIRGLEERLNQELKGVLYKDESLEGDNVAITVTKIGDMTVRAENDKLYFALPLNIYAKGRFQWKACDICPEIGKTEDTRFGLTVKCESALALTEDYKVKSTTVSDFEWGDKPTISLGPLKISLARFVEPAMKSQMATLSQQLDRELANKVNIKPYIQQAWMQMQQPILLDKTLGAWLVISPQEIRISPLQARNGEVSLKAGIRAFIETVTDGKPTVKPNSVLPKLITDKNLANDVQIGLIGEISYDHASRLLKEQLAGKQFTFEGGKQQVLVKDASLSGSADKLVLMMDVDGKAKAGFFTKKIIGKVYLSAVPYYDAATGSIRVRDVDYTLDTKDALLKTAGWLAKGSFKKNLQDQINFPIKGQIDEAKKSLQQSLDKPGNLPSNISLKGTVTDLVPDDIYLTEKSIKAIVNAKGNLQVRVEKF